MAIGRPPKFKTAEEFTKQADAYFAECGLTEEPITITGLCLALDTTRDVLIDYEKGLHNERDASFSHAIKRAKMVVERTYEKRLAGNNPTGAIFALKNFGWSDKIQNELSGPNGGAIQAEITINLVDPKNGTS